MEQTNIGTNQIRRRRRLPWTFSVVNEQGDRNQELGDRFDALFPGRKHCPVIIVLLLDPRETEILCQIFIVYSGESVLRPVAT